MLDEIGSLPLRRGPHIVLVGLPGAGKSTVGVLLAERLGCPFLDFDSEIEQRRGMSVARIFETEGEDSFRRQERALTDEVAALPGMVLAPGGGWMAREGNVSVLRPPARLIHLWVPVALALERLGGDIGTRPLLAESENPSEMLAKLAVSRLSQYRQADAEIDTQMLTPQSVVRDAARLAIQWGW